MENGPSRTICYVTGTRAEFGLMANTLRAIQKHPRLRLQLVVTGMHLDRAAGRSIDQLRSRGWAIDATVPWKSADNNSTVLARRTGISTARLADVFAKLKPDVVMVTGDRVEAFAAATSAHLSQMPLAHVHGGDRAMGQVDDTLRHAITKLAHIHFPATRESAERILRLGEDRRRIFMVGTPGLEKISADAAPRYEVESDFTDIPFGRYALILLHPTSSDESSEYASARMILDETISTGFDGAVIIGPNTDPGAAGILKAWNSVTAIPDVVFHEDLPRGMFLGLLRDAAVLVGNSSSGIIEAASFGTPVIDIGPRQQGRQRGENVTTVPMRQAAIRAALKKIWNNGKPIRYPKHNIYGRGDTANRICRVLSSIRLDQRLLRKLIAY